MRNNRKTIYLVRHCEYENPRKIIPGRLPVPLSETGRSRALRLRDYFADKEIELIYSSAVLRCKQTSEIVSSERFPIKFDLRLVERLIAYQGYRFEGKVNYRYLYSMRKELGGESWQDLQERMVSFFKELVGRKEKSFIVCSHGDPLYTLILYLKEKPLIKEDIDPFSLTDYPGKGSVIKVDYNRKITKADPAFEV